MASPDAFRSSPLRRERFEIRSSSPDLPPLQDLVSRKSPRRPLRSGSKAQPIPHDAPASFITARNLWNSRESARDCVCALDDSAPSGPPQNVATSDSIVEITEEELFRSTQTKASNPNPSVKPRAGPTVNPHVASPSPESDKSWRKFRSPKISKSKDKAPQSDDLNEAPSADVEISKAPSTPVVKPARLPESTNAADEPLQIEQATTRRLDWTPPAQKTVLTVDSGSGGNLLDSSPSGDEQQAGSFRNHLQSFTCQEEASSTNVAPSGDELGVLKKRKLIELAVNTNDANTWPEREPEKKAPKKKASKKKARTITDLATAAYRHPSQLETSTTSSIVNYVESNNQDPTSTTEVAKKSSKPKPARKKAPKASKKKAPPPPKPKLLSPGAALAQVSKQDFVFGTSSQLAREPSPTVLRDLQTAMRESANVEEYDLVTPINSDAIEPVQHKPKLWEAAARDADGDLFDIEVVDLAEDSPPLHTNPESDPFGYSKRDDQQLPPLDPVEIEDSTLCDSFTSLPEIRHSRGGDVAPPPLEIETTATADVEPQKAASVNRALAQTETATKPPTQPSTQPKPNSHQAPRPKYELYSDVQLAKEIRVFGFKPIKRRAAMIALLDQCWRSKSGFSSCGIHTSAPLTAAAPPAANAPAGPQTAASPTKRPRGRPRKTSVGSPTPQEPPPSAQPTKTPPRRPRGRPRKDMSSSPSITSRARTVSATTPTKSRASQSPSRAEKKSKPKVIEIPDSASDLGSNLASSPSSSMAEELLSSPPAMDLSLSGDEGMDLSLTLSPTEQQAALFNHITQAIKSAPRTSDPSNPSWHDKMLLYDPIILEDLTAWLNTGHLSRVGYDGEVSPAEVKTWCESKSVCCLWKVNLRGKERKRL